MYNRRRGVLAIAVFASCAFNYYFFAGQVVFVLIYWIVRMVSGSFRITLRDFLRMAAEVLIGFGASAVILVPSVLAVLQNPRVERLGRFALRLRTALYPYFGKLLFPAGYSRAAKLYAGFQRKVGFCSRMAAVVFHDGRYRVPAGKKAHKLAEKANRYAVYYGVYPNPQQPVPAS